MSVSSARGRKAARRAVRVAKTPVPRSSRRPKLHATHPRAQRRTRDGERHLAAGTTSGGTRAAMPKLLVRDYGRFLAIARRNERWAGRLTQA